MRPPAEDEIAAIAAAYAAFAERAGPAPSPELPGWRIAARLPRLAAARPGRTRRGSLWRAAARPA